MLEFHAIMPNIKTIKALRGSFFKRIFSPKIDLSKFENILFLFEMGPILAFTASSSLSTEKISRFTVCNTCTN